MAFGGLGHDRGGLHRPLAEINVTPLVDVMLVLLIVFMITAPMLAQGLKVDLPQARSAQTINPKDPIVVSVTREGRVAIGTDEMDVSQMIEALTVRMEGDNKRIIQLRADKDANYGAMMTVIDLLASNGMVHITLITDRKKSAGAPLDAVQPAMSAAPVGVSP